MSGRISSWIIPLMFHAYISNGQVISLTLSDPASYVNPFIGTAASPVPSKWEGHGRTYPGAVAPFGSVQITPETRLFSSRGYDYGDTSIYYFSCINHSSGYPSSSAGNIFIMPVDDTAGFRFGQYIRKFSHDDETAQPGYYSVFFPDNGTLVEATVSERTGMFRTTFGQGTVPRFFIGDIGNVSAISKGQIRGSRYNTIIEFGEEYTEKLKVDGGHILSFDASGNGEKELLIKISTSAVGFESAGRNLEVENPGWDFDSLKYSARSKWNGKLSVIEVEDSCSDSKMKFYTALYHSLLIPWIISDVDGYYRGADRMIHRTNGSNQYGLFSPWDTFRSLHPLLCLVSPDRQNDMILSMLDIYHQTSRLPKGPMTGNHIIPIIFTFWDNRQDPQKLAY